jgi:general secretion pathway protein G
MTGKRENGKRPRSARAEAGDWHLGCTWESPAERRPKEVSNRTSKGFTLIELLIVVAIIGIIAAIAIPNLLNAIDRGKQKRTMADVRSVGTAIESYAVDTNRYPTSANMAALPAVLSPIYIRTLPLSDGWKNPMVYTPNAGTGYTVGSGGKDGGALTVVGAGGATTNFNDALIFINGQFVQFPEGQQQ